MFSHPSAYREAKDAPPHPTPPHPVASAEATGAAAQAGKAQTSVCTPSQRSFLWLCSHGTRLPARAGLCCGWWCGPPPLTDSPHCFTPAGGHSSRGVAAAPAITGPFPAMAVGGRKRFKCGWVRAEAARSPDRPPLVLEKQSLTPGAAVGGGWRGPSGPRSWAELACVGGTRLQQDRAGGCHLLRMVPALTTDQDRP